MKYVVLTAIAFSAFSGEPWRWIVMAGLATLLMILFAWDKDQAEARVASLEKELGYTRSSGASMRQIIAGHSKKQEKTRPTPSRQRPY